MTQIIKINTASFDCKSSYIFLIYNNVFTKMTAPKLMLDKSWRSFLQALIKWDKHKIFH